MFYKFQYSSQNERETIIQNNPNLTLHEEQNITEGNFLVFTDNVPIVNQDIERLENANLILMDALATVFEEILNLQAIQGGTV